MSKQGWATNVHENVREICEARSTLSHPQSVLLFPSNTFTQRPPANPTDKFILLCSRTFYPLYLKTWPSLPASSVFHFSFCSVHPQFNQGITCLGEGERERGNALSPCCVRFDREGGVPTSLPPGTTWNWKDIIINTKHHRFSFRHNRHYQSEHTVNVNFHRIE